MIPNENWPYNVKWTDIIDWYPDPHKEDPERILSVQPNQSDWWNVRTTMLLNLNLIFFMQVKRKASKRFFVFFVFVLCAERIQNFNNVFYFCHGPQRKLKSELIAINVDTVEFLAFKNWRPKKFESFKRGREIWTLSLYEVNELMG